ncbi:hypothetical protein FDUTEX481_03639 [Tolypothrix sp. PCC 7601]|nr:hypothetical protein FDUTEX481_03639 [Tolypothrix sp. PCC 7601]
MQLLSPLSVIGNRDVIFLTHRVIQNSRLMIVNFEFSMGAQRLS